MVERLEGRTLLAGDVTATVTGGQLSIVGDAAGNQITIERLNTGIKIVGRAGTSVNGSSADAIFPDAGKNISIDTGAGRDSVEIFNPSPAAKVQVDLGSGDDDLFIRTAKVSREIRVEGGPGKDDIRLWNVTMFGRLLINAGLEDDRVRIENSSLANAEIDDTDGKSSLFVGSTRFRGDFAFASGNRADHLAISATQFDRETNIRTRRGVDSIQIEDSTFQNSPLIDDGPENDQTQIAESFNFNHGKQGWEAKFADYPAGQKEGPPWGTAEVLYALKGGLAPLPPEMHISERAFMLSGKNFSDDLFLFLARQFGPGDGLTPDGKYQLTFEIRLATDFPTGYTAHSISVGALSRPLEIRKVGNYAPDLDVRVVGDDGKSRASYDNELATVGQLASDSLPVPPSKAAPFSSIYRKLVFPRMVQAGHDANLTLLTGIDSAYEVPVTVYVRSVRVTLAPLQ